MNSEYWPNILGTNMEINIIVIIAFIITILKYSFLNLLSKAKSIVYSPNNVVDIYLASNFLFYKVLYNQESKYTLPVFLKIIWPRFF